MKQWRFEVCNKAGFPDVQGASTLTDIKEFGINAVEAVQFARVYLIEADIVWFFAVMPLRRDPSYWKTRVSQC